MDDKTPANNTMRELPDGIIELTQTGYQTTKSIIEHANEISELVKKRRADKKPALLLVDISGITGHDSDVRDIAHNNLTNDFDALAIVTAENVTARLIGNWLVKLVGQGERVRFFASHDDAFTWLKTER